MKLLAKGELKSKFNIIVDKASAGAIKAVEKASGKIEVKEKVKEV
ncbi:MAG: uL15 family ribosomal protein [Candidatus Peribacteria bacterium]|nr:uL15 family ribosomal protein [Candidatus Peribacteria bacterium]